MQNSKNHENEVALRIQFESKLNQMHSYHRDVDGKYKKCLEEVVKLQNYNEDLVKANSRLNEQVCELKTLTQEQECKLTYKED